MTHGGDSAVVEFGAREQAPLRCMTGQAGQLPVMSSYPAHGRVQLHSLRRPVAVECARCRMVRESVMLATIRAGAQLAVVCPRCSHHYLAEQARPNTTNEQSAALPAAACVTTAERDPTRVNRIVTVAVAPDDGRLDRRATPGSCRSFKPSR